MGYANLDNVDALLNGDLYKRNLHQLGEVCSGKADAYIDSYLAVVYSTPFTTTPAQVANIAEDLTIYYLFRTNFYAGVAGNDQETRDQLKADADKALKDIVTGKAKLPDVDAADLGGNEELIDSTREEYHPSVDMGPEEDWGVDEDLLEEIEDERDT